MKRYNFYVREEEREKLSRSFFTRNYIELTETNELHIFYTN